MDPLHILILAAAGLAGGFVAGLLGVGGGIIFSPVLLFFYQGVGVADELVVPMTAGSSLFCTLVAAASGTLSQAKLGMVRGRIVWIAGVFAALAVTAMTVLVTTKPWYNQTVFGVVLAVILLLAVARMLRAKTGDALDARGAGDRVPVPLLALTGAGAGAVASAAGVGGGIVMVPVYNQFLRLRLKEAAATSMATIVLISLSGVVVYALRGLGAGVPPTAVGYVDVGRALWLAVPALVTARLGVRVAARVDTRVIRYGFAALATAVALRLLWRAFV
jgi:uncharacterized protein